MTLRRVPAALVLALVVVAGGCGAGPDEPEQDPYAATSGGRLVDVSLDSLSGGAPLDLGELRGPAVVNVWASWCGPCRAELPMYEEFADAHGDRVAVVGIASEDSSDRAARALVARTGVTYPTYTDPDGELRAIALPQVVLVDESGGIAFSQYLEITGAEQLEDLAREHLGVDL